MCYMIARIGATYASWLLGSGYRLFHKHPTIEFLGETKLISHMLLFRDLTFWMKNSVKHHEPYITCITIKKQLYSILAYLGWI